MMYLQGQLQHGHTDDWIFRSVYHLQMVDSHRRSGSTPMNGRAPGARILVEAAEI